jgi:hypothetical protein
MSSVAAGPGGLNLCHLPVEFFGALIVSAIVNSRHIDFE